MLFSPLLAYIISCSTFDFTYLPYFAPSLLSIHIQKKGISMKSVSFEELATITYVLTDDWYQKEGKNLVRETVGQKPVFSNSEVLTLLLLMELFAISRRRAIFGLHPSQLPGTFSAVARSEPAQPPCASITVVNRGHPQVLA